MSSCAPGVPSLFGKSGGEPVGSRSCSELVSAVPFCNVMRVLKTECDGTVHLQAVQIEEEVQMFVQKDTESLMVYCARGEELMRKMDVLRFADKDRRMVFALVRGLRHEIRGSVASKIAERPNQTFQEVVTFLRRYDILAGDATTGKLQHAMIGLEKIGGLQKKKQKQGGKQKNPKIQCWR